jgi:CheY-like chemotaxis protein
MSLLINEDPPLRCNSGSRASKMIERPDTDAKPTRSHERRRVRTLVVDDEPDTVATTAVLLRLLGHEVYEANSGLQAIELSNVVDPDVILLDIRMPKLDGLETARHIRRLQLQHQPLIVAITAWGEATDRLAAEDAGIDVHLLKPVELDVLRSLF